MAFERLAWVALVAIDLVLWGTASALAQDYPSRPVTFVVPYAAGGTLDTIARSLGRSLSEKFGKPVLIENRAGGGIGSNALARAPSDGHTILMVQREIMRLGEVVKKSGATAD